MICYEVNLTVDAAVAEAYAAWLHEHARQMLAVAGFERADWYAREEDDPDGDRHWTVCYHVASEAHLQEYFDHHAARMRGDGLDRFEGPFTAGRRVLRQVETFG